MDAKINLQQLAKSMAQRKKISQRAAEAFLRSFFDAIIQNVTIAKMVKIKGLGIFKLIEVQDRESIDVTTGERIVIPGHSKLSFSPDISLRNLINKPFADFQTVIINDGTSLEEMEMIPEEALADEEEEQDEEELRQEAESDEEPESELEPELELESELEEESEEQDDTPESEDEPEPEPESEPEPKPESVFKSDSESVPTPVMEQEKDEVSEKIVQIRAMTFAEKCAMAVGGLLLFLAGYYCHVLFSSSDSPVVEEELASVESPIEEILEDTLALNEDTIPKILTQENLEETDSAAATVPERVERSQEEAIRPTLVSGRKYQITGTRKTHVMKPGDYLTKIALEEYGAREFAKYIIAHNHFTDPNNVPVGKEILLPELEEVR